MSFVIRHCGKVNEKGVPVFNNRPLFDKHTQSLIGKEFELIIREKPKDITPEQLAYYFGAILKTAYNSEQFGHYNQSSDLHKEVIEPMFLTEYEVKVVGGVKQLKKTITKLSSMSRQETALFIEKVKIFFEMEGITFLSRDEYYLKK